ncbi:MAG: hotdog domain-containing protein [Bacillota bacterium]
MSITKGLQGKAHMVVRKEDTALMQGSGTVRVLSTPRLLALMEAAAVAALNGSLRAGQTSVGTKVEIEHTAATPVGMEVFAKAELVEIDGRRLVFAVEAYDAAGTVGRGRHERFLVDEDRFLERAEQKRAKR